MRIPSFLKENGSIGFVAPSYGCNIEPYKTAFDSAQQTFKNMGHTLILGPNCYAGSGIGISNTPELCGEELGTFLGQKKTDVVISCGGGELMCEVLDYVDFDAIMQAQPSWYMGFSDNTNMTFILPTMCDTAAIYAPCAPAFGMKPWHPAVEDAYRLLRGDIDEVHGYDMWEKDSLKSEDNPLEPYNVTEKSVIRCYNTDGDDVQISGRLIGGCLDCLDILVGTKYDKVSEFNDRYKEDGIIWFMEACDLNPMGIRRAIWQLKHAGWFGHVRGFLIGRPMCFGEEAFGLDHYHAVTDLLVEYNVPIIMDLDIGHIPPMMPIVSGSKAKVNILDGQIHIKYLFK